MFQQNYNTDITSSKSEMIKAFDNTLTSTRSRHITNHRKKYLRYFTYLNVDLSSPEKQDEQDDLLIA